MITRREAIAGTVAAATVAVTGIPAAAKPAPPPEPVKAADLVRADDLGLWRDLEAIEQIVARMKTRLIAANSKSAVVRSAYLFEMRCGLPALRCEIDSVFFRSYAKKDEIDEALRLERSGGV